MNEQLMDAAGILLSNDDLTTLQKLPCPPEYSWMSEQWNELMLTSYSTNDLKTLIKK